MPHAPDRTLVIAGNDRRFMIECQSIDMPSSVVAYMSYDAASATLRVRFVSGRVYDYEKVPERVFRAMKNADSKGTYLNEHIKGFYAFKKVK
jgi:hypothetical protein